MPQFRSLQSSFGTVPQRSAPSSLRPALLLPKPSYSRNTPLPAKPVMKKVIFEPEKSQEDEIPPAKSEVSSPVSRIKISSLISPSRFTPLKTPLNTSKSDLLSPLRTPLNICTSKPDLLSPMSSKPGMKTFVWKPSTHSPPSMPSKGKTSVAARFESNQDDCESDSDSIYSNSEFDTKMGNKSQPTNDENKKQQKNMLSEIETTPKILSNVAANETTPKIASNVTDDLPRSENIQSNSSDDLPRNSQILQDSSNILKNPWSALRLHSKSDKENTMKPTKNLNPFRSSTRLTNDEQSSSNDTTLHAVDLESYITTSYTIRSPSMLVSKSQTFFDVEITEITSPSQFIFRFNSDVFEALSAEMK